MKNSLLVISIIIASLNLYGGQRQYIVVDSIVDGYSFLIDTMSVELAIEARASFDFGRNSPHRSTQRWGIAWNVNEEDSFDYVSLRMVNTDFGAITDVRAAEIEYGHHVAGLDSVLKRVVVEKGHNVGGGENSLSVEWFDGRMRVFSGEKVLQPALETDAALPQYSSCRIFSSGRLGLSSVVVENEEDMSKKLSTDYDLNELMLRLDDSQDPLEGTWSYLDRVTDDNRARAGGAYNLVVVKENEQYLALYHSGAKVNGKKWRQMMIKGVLTSTPFVGHFDVKWYDSMMNVVDDECSATLDNEGILSLSFPLHKTLIRFYKGGVYK